MIATPAMTIRKIVANDYRAAVVFERYGLDFCCGGGRTIEQGCNERGVDRDALLRDLDEVPTAPAVIAPAYSTWDAATLIDYIVSHHHGYVRDAMPGLLRYVQKLVEVHSGRHPGLPYIGLLVSRIAHEMTNHMVKEEQILFPHIRALEAALRDGRPVPPAPFGSMRNLIRAMEGEHQFVGDAMAEICQLTDDYQPPDGACAMHRFCLQELDDFERDLHAHVHLENNILFPKALALDVR